MKKLLLILDIFIFVMSIYLITKNYSLNNYTETMAWFCVCILSIRNLFNKL